MHPFPHKYEMTYTDTGSQEGLMSCGELPDVKVSAPKEFDGPNTGWSPENLFLSSIGACIALTFGAIAKMMNVEYSNLTLTMSGSVDKFEGNRMKFTSITIKPSLTLANPADESKLGKILENTEKH